MLSSEKSMYVSLSVCMSVLLMCCRDLKMREKIELLHRICHWRLELDDIGDTLRVCVCMHACVRVCVLSCCMRHC